MQIHVSNFNNVYLQFWQFLHSFTAADVLPEVKREGKLLCKDDMFRNVSNVCWGSGGLNVREARLWSEKRQNVLQWTDNRSLTWPVLCLKWQQDTQKFSLCITSTAQFKLIVYLINVFESLCTHFQHHRWSAIFS